MEKVKIKLISIGQLPKNFSRDKILKWKSSVFEIVDLIDSHTLTCDSDADWSFSDEKILSQFPQELDGDFAIALVTVPIEDNWFTRPLGPKRIVFSFHEIKDILFFSNIPLENPVLRILYATTLVYKSSNNTIRNWHELEGLTHDETRGCLFDMNGIKSDITVSCSGPIICSSCQEKLRERRVSDDAIQKIQAELKRIRKPLYYRIFDFIKQHPIFSLIISSVFALCIGILGSLLASIIYDLLKSWFHVTS